jgi:hypothetical protein
MISIWEDQASAAHANVILQLLCSLKALLNILRTAVALERAPHAFRVALQ